MRGLFVGIILFVSPLAFGRLTESGGNGSGGGMGVVCKNVDGSIKSVELLDLWEARVIYGRSIQVSSDPLEQQLETHLQNFKNSYFAGGSCIQTSGWSCDVFGPAAVYEFLRWETEKLQSNSGLVHRLRGATLQRTNDSFEVVTPSTCTIEQLVRYTDNPHGGEVLINQDLLDHMNTTNVAALYLHEALYKQLRQTGERSSLRVRRAVGLGFSGHKFRSLESLLPAQFYDCWGLEGGVHRIFVYVPEKGFCANEGVVYQVVTLSGMQKMDFTDSESGCIKTPRVEDVFASQFPWTSAHSFGRTTGFDYAVQLEIGGPLFRQGARIKLSSAPDGQPSVAGQLTCTLKTTPY